MANCPACGTQEVRGQQYCSSCGSLSSSVYANPAPLPSFPAESTLTGYTLATFWKRFLGYLIDYILLTVAGVLILASVHGSFITGVIIVVALSFVYNSVFIGFVHGQTLGMRILSIKCVDQDGHTEIDYARAAKRALFYSVLLFLGNLEELNRYTNPTTAQVHHELHEELVYLVFRIPFFIDLLWVAWDRKNQTLHDKYARTIVISTK
jgi:uncharacterized RDD family membrane protein YckC